MPFPGGKHAPGHYLPGGAAGFGGYVFSGYQSLFFANPAGTSSAQRTIVSGASAGDLMVAFAAEGPGQAGQSSVALRTPTLAAWSSAGGILNFQGAPINRFVTAIQPRFATGTSEDDCLITNQIGFPIFLGVAVFSGSVFAGTLATITADNESSILLANNVASMFRENCPPNGFAITLKTWLTAKQAGVAQALDGVSATDQGIISLDLLNTGDNGFGQTMILACGYKFEEFAVDTPVGVWPLSSAWSGNVYASSATFKSGDS